MYFYLSFKSAFVNKLRIFKKGNANPINLMHFWKAPIKITQNQDKDV